MQKLNAALQRLEVRLVQHSFLGDTPLAYLIVAGLVLFAFVVRLAIAPVEAGLQYVTFFPAVTLAAVIGGFRPGLFATLLGIFFATFVFTPPYWVFGLDSLITAFWSNTVFLLDGVIVSFSIASMHRYREKYQSELIESKQSELETQRLNHTLQELVAKREAEFIDLKKFEDIVRCSDEAIISLTPAGIITSWNPGAEKIFAYSAQEVLGQSINLLLPADRQDEAASYIERLVRGEHFDHVVTTRCRKGGEVVEVSASISPIRDFFGNFVGVSKIVRDITQTQAARKQLDMFFLISLDLLGIAGGDGYLKRVNPGFLKVLGWTEQEMFARPYLDFVHPEDVEATRHEVERQIQYGEQVLNFENRYRHKDGSWRLISWMSRPGEDGLIYATGRDITEQHAAAEALRQSNEKNRLILQCAGEGIYGIDMTGKIVFANPATASMLGWTVDELVGQVAHHLMHHHHADGSLYLCGDCKVTQTLQDGQSCRIENELFWRKDGSSFPVSYTSTAMRTDAGEIVGAIVTFSDITHIKQIQLDLLGEKERAEQANRTKASFLAAMSHEIRTPLGGMMGMLELLSMTHLDAEQMATLDIAWSSARGLLRIVNDILDWSKIEDGKLEINLVPSSLGHLLQDVVNTYSRTASAKSLVLWQHVDARLNRTYALDPLRLSQVLNNFVSNAIKFTERGEIEVRASLLDSTPAGDRICFSVKDTGIGISQDNLSRLFQIYMQASSDTARMYGGTGLGLAICQRLAELMGGELAVSSEPGQGSVFSITLLLEHADALTEISVSRKMESPSIVVQPLFQNTMEAPLILIVDDHPTNRELLARQVHMLGLRAVTAENGRTGLMLWLDGRFDMVITDCHMPEMDGYELTRSIRKLETNKNLPRSPVIAWTANALSEEQQRCAEAGMDELLVKPVNLPELRVMLAKWLNVKQQEGAEVDTQVLPDTQIDPAPVDYSVLDGIIADKAEQGELLLKFLAHIKQDRDKLAQELAQGMEKEIQGTAHRMKGSSRMVGVMGVGNACSIIEQAAKQGDVNTALTTLAVLDAALKQLEVYLLRN